MASGFSMPRVGANDVDIVLIGKTGNGKSSTGNSILGKRAFKSMSTTQSVTLHVDYDFCEFNGRIIKVVDGPGVGDNRMSDVQAKQLLQDKFKEAVLNNPQGYHAFIIVVKFGGRFTKEDTQTIVILKQIFGQDFVRNHCILVMSYGDNFEVDQENDCQTFEAWCRGQGGIFSELLAECNNRIVLFHNTLKPEYKDKRAGQVTRLLELIDSLGGRRYTDKHFEEARHLRERQILEAKEPHIQESTLKEATIISQKLREAQQLDIHLQKKALKELRTHAERLYEDVKAQDMGTNVLRHALHAAASILEEIKTQREYGDRVLKERKEAEERQEKMARENEERRKKEKEEFEKQMEADRIALEQKKEKQQKEMLERFQQESEASDRRHKQMLEALKEEMKNKSEEERRQREREMEQREQRRREEEKERSDRERRDFERRLQDEKERLDRDNERHQALIKKMDEDSDRKMEQMMKMFKESMEAQQKQQQEAQRRQREETERRIREMKEAEQESSGGCTIL